MQNLILLLMGRSNGQNEFVRAELSHFPSKNLSDSPFQRGVGGEGELISSDVCLFLRYEGSHFELRGAAGEPSAHSSRWVRGSRLTRAAGHGEDNRRGRVHITSHTPVDPFGVGGLSLDML